MTWTSERPKVPGFYWFRPFGEALSRFPYDTETAPVKLDPNPNGDWAWIIGSEVPANASEMEGGLWWGPIEPPA